MKILPYKKLYCFFFLVLMDNHLDHKYNLYNMYHLKIHIELFHLLNHFLNLKLNKIYHYYLFF